MYSFYIKKLTIEQKILRRRILEISNKSNLSHIGSCLSAIDLIDAVYKVKNKSEKFVLSNGHAGVALYTVLEKYGYIKNPKITQYLNIHPDRNLKHDIHVSTGSLGQGLPIALGLAFANKKKNVYCMVSDGEMAEGSIWESLRVTIDQKVTNLKIIINANGWSAYDKVDLNLLTKRIKGFGFEILKVDGHKTEMIIKTLKRMKKNKQSILFAHTTVNQLYFLKGQDAHYHVMQNDEYEKAIQNLR